MEFTTQPGVLPSFGRVEKVYADGRWVGFVYRDPKGVAELPELWIGYTQGGRGARTREEALQIVIEHARANPDFEAR